MGVSSDCTTDVVCGPNSLRRNTRWVLVWSRISREIFSSHCIYPSIGPLISRRSSRVTIEFVFRVYPLFPVFYATSDTLVIVHTMHSNFR